MPTKGCCTLTKSPPALEEQQALLTAMQDRAFPHFRSFRAFIRSAPKPRRSLATLFLIAAGNLDAIQGMHPALRARIRGYGYEVYVNSEMPDTARNRRRLIRFIAQEVLRDLDTVLEIPHFDVGGVAGHPA